MVGLRLGPDDHRKVSEAIAAAEAGSDGEILTIVSGDSDSYHDVALHWAVAAMIGVLALCAWQAAGLASLWEALFGWGEQASAGEVLFAAMVLAVLGFLLALLLLKPRAFRVKAN